MTIQEALQNILQAVFGKDVRQSIHDGIDAINKESKADMEAKQAVIEAYTAKQDLLDQKYDNLLDELSKTDPSLAEVVDARMNAAGITYQSLKLRLDTCDDTLLSLKTTFEAYQSELSSKIYPVGAIYMSTVNVDPSVLFGGEWERWGEGRVPVGVNEREIEFATTEKKDGEKTHIHTTGDHKLMVEEIPSHRHNLTADYIIVNSGYDANGLSQNGGLPTKWSTGYYTAYAGGNASHNHGNTSNANNLPPYITCYMWVRRK